MFYFWFTLILLTFIALLFLTLPFLREKKTCVFTNYLLLIFLFIAVPLGSFSLYFHWGNSSKISQGYAMKDRAAEIKTAINKFGSRQKIIAALKAKLEQRPEDKESARGWYLLGKLYLGNQQLKPAITALEKAFQLNPSNPEISLALVTSKYYVNKHLDSAEKNLLQQITHASIPYNIEAINLLAMDAYQNQKYEEAIHYWEQLLPLFPANTKDGSALLTIIAGAQRKRAEANKVGISISTVRLNIAIHIDDKIKSKTNLSDVLFVYASSLNGTKIPLAVKKIVSPRFPLKVSLDDNDAMLANHKLSTASEIKIAARISKSGTAIAQSGDLIGTVITKMPVINVINLLIDQQI